MEDNMLEIKELLKQLNEKVDMIHKKLGISEQDTTLKNEHTKEIQWDIHRDTFGKE